MRLRTTLLWVTLVMATSLVFLNGCGNSNSSSTASTSSTLNETNSNEISAKASTTVTTESALKTAVANAKAGDVITISGTIKLTSTLQLLASGTSSSKINISGGTLDCSGTGGWGVKVNGSYWNIQNIHITKAPSVGICFQSGGYNYVNNLTTDYCGDSGFQIYNGAHDNNVVNCKSNYNYDSATSGENADGFACKLSAGAGNKFTSCTATYNSDDGWDLYGQPYPVTISGCTANNNGKGSAGDGNGFKLGSSGLSVAHVISNCSASNNSPGWGFTRNGNAKGVIKYSGLTGSGNAAGLSDL